MNLKYVNLLSLFPVSALHCLKTITWNHLIKKKKKVQKWLGKCQFEEDTVRDSAAKLNVISQNTSGFCRNR